MQEEIIPCYGFELLSKELFASKKKTKQSADDFDKMTLHESIFIRPQNLMGSPDPISRDCNIYSLEEQKIYMKSILMPRAQERQFLEILTNSTDGIRQSRENGIICGNIKVIFGRDFFSIENDGLPIPVLPTKYSNENLFELIPESIFGDLLSGSNLNDEYERGGSGANAYGAKLSNIMSVLTQVDVGDNIRGCYFNGIWTGNMKNKYISCEPEYIWKNKSGYVLNGEKYEGENFVRVLCYPDFRRFKPDEKEGEYCFSQDDYEYYLFLLYTASVGSKITIDVKFTEDVFGEELKFKINTKNIEKFSELFADFPKKGRVFSRTWNKDQLKLYNKIKENAINEGIKEDTKKFETIINKHIENNDIYPEVEMFIYDTPNKGKFVSCCNGIYNYKGGEYVDESYRTVLSFIKTCLISDKSFQIPEDVVNKYDIRSIKKHVSIIIMFNCISPSWDTQEKNSADKPKPKISISLENSKIIKGWNMLDEYYNTYHGKSTNVKGAKRTKRHIGKNSQDAYYVGKKGQVNTANVCEGTSAGGYLETLITNLPGGFDNNGTFNLSGKIRNITGIKFKNINALLKSGEKNIITRLIEFIGLEKDVDYTITENLKKCNYEKLNIIVDADSDGIHILCLLINILYIIAPTYIKAGCVFWFITPLIRAIDKNDETIANFTTKNDYDEWVKENPSRRHKPDYFKGLASSSEKQACDDALTAPLPLLYFDDEAEMYINIAFSKSTGSAGDRKIWYLKFKQYIDQQIIESEKEGKYNVLFVRISNLLNSRLIEFIGETLTRSLPHAIDGLKHSQRQLTYYFAVSSKYGESPQSKKIAAHASNAQQLCEYHHGTLGVTLARMVTCYAGKNNLRLLKEESQTGSRYELGKDCGADRYTKTKVGKVFEFIYKKELCELIDYNYVEGIKVEFKHMVPIIPTILCNGGKGVATGWSNVITCYNAIDITNLLIHFITTGKGFAIGPWYNNYNGYVYLEVKTKKCKVENKDLKNEAKDEEDNEDEEDEENNKNEEDNQNEEDNEETYLGLTCRTEGIYKIHKEYTGEIIKEIDDPDNAGKKKKIKEIVPHYDLEILEIPIGIEPKSLDQRLSALSKDGGRKLSKSKNNPHYMYKGYHGSIDPVDIGMISRQGLSNITMVDDEGLPMNFKNIYAYIMHYYNFMDNLFVKLKVKKIDILKDKLKKLKAKAIIIEQVTKNGWIFIGRTRKQVDVDLNTFGVSREIFKSINSEMYEKDGYDEIKKMISNLSEELNKIITSDHLQIWLDYLNELSIFLNKDKFYHKLPKHEFEYVECEMEDLVSGKILFPKEYNKLEIKNEK